MIIDALKEIEDPRSYNEKRISTVANFVSCYFVDFIQWQNICGYSLIYRDSLQQIK